MTTTPQPIEGSNAFDQPGEWLKAALHTHSTVSDGTVAPEPLAMAYQEAGFDVLAITDHWRLTKFDAPDGLLTLPSAELGFDVANPLYPTQSTEFLVYGIDHIPDEPGGNKDNWYSNPIEHYEVRTFADLSSGVRWADSMGAVVYVAHPYWNQMNLDELVDAEGFVGLEVFNGSSDLETARGDSSVWWDALLARGRRTFGIATDDQHYPLFELGTAWTMIRAADRSQEAVLHALREGHTYFSHGPTIHGIHVDGDAVEVECSPARSVVLAREEEKGVCVNAGPTGRRMGRVVAEDGRGLFTHVRLESPYEDVRYRRVVVVDEFGRKAWSNPI